jgi:phospholipid-binding lipoprotein MlaA
MRASITRGALLLVLAAFLAFAALATAGEEGDGVSSLQGPESPQGESPELEPDPLFDDAFDDFEDFGGPEVYDPLESGNRAVFRFNQKVDRYFWDPITRGYRFAVPQPVRRSVRRVFLNLNTPVYVVNHLLQVRFDAAAETLAAFVMNSTYGVGGIFDAGSRVGLQLRPADFGQTLALAGVGNGPYLVIPLLGPSTVRDGVGLAVDRFFHPFTYFMPLYPQLMWGGGVGVAWREEAGEKLAALEESALDFYAVLRSAYVQAREQSIEDCRRRSDDDEERRQQRLEAFPLDDGRVFGPAQRELAHRAVQVHVDDLPAAALLPESVVEFHLVPIRIEQPGAHQPGAARGGLLAEGLELLAGIAFEAAGVVRDAEAREGLDETVAVLLGSRLPVPADGFLRHEGQLEDLLHDGGKALVAALVAEGFGVLHHIDQGFVEPLHDLGGARLRRAGVGVGVLVAEGGEVEEEERQKPHRSASPARTLGHGASPSGGTGADPV